MPRPRGVTSSTTGARAGGCATGIGCGAICGMSRAGIAGADSDKNGFDSAGAGALGENGGDCAGIGNSGAAPFDTGFGAPGAAPLYALAPPEEYDSANGFEGSK